MIPKNYPIARDSESLADGDNAVFPAGRGPDTRGVQTMVGINALQVGLVPDRVKRSTIEL